ncbi:MAG TPA: transcriptional regulator [Brevundimonas sp.]|jgi:DNA-binding MarR family transcriptional regulator|uniref:winged helix-turn-helix domain-containing protein n=1 Tax=Brevundimonas sp. TaxID=1871086 RepID=UPI002B877E88|nr:transcriptional regulator [Brevundimonas sp.]HRH20679.1 transcriptional regulator [Brevundimonas sp.]
MSHAPVFDAVIHAPGRLQICAILSSVDDAEFAMIRDAIKVSDSVLSKHLKQLEEAGYVKLTKQAENGRQRTWIALTPAGRKTFAAHVAELQRLAALTAPEPMGQGFAG